MTSEQLHREMKKGLRMKKSDDGSIRYYITAKSVKRIKEIKEDYEQYLDNMLDSDGVDYELNSDYPEEALDEDIERWGIDKNDFINALKVIDMDVEEYCHGHYRDMTGFGFIPLKTIEELGKYCFGEDDKYDYEGLGRVLLRKSTIVFFEGFGALFIREKAK